MCEIKYKIGKIDITIKCSEKDYDWIKIIFSKCSEPFKVLHAMGYQPEYLH